MKKAIRLFKVATYILPWIITVILLQKVRNPSLTPHKHDSAIATPSAIRPSYAESSVPDIFSNSSPGVVSVANRALVRDGYSYRLHEIPQGAGTGFVWDDQGHIVSNFHVISGASSVNVTLSNRKSYDAELVGADPLHDIAVLRIKAPADELSPLTAQPDVRLAVGQRVLAIGNPFGLDSSLSVGVISALGRSITSPAGRPIYDCIQTDAAINPGNSGGPLLNDNGQLVGMNTAIVSGGGGNDGIGFAIPISTIGRIVPRLISGKSWKRPGLGITMVPDHILQQAGISGVGIADIVRGSTADQNKLKGLQRTYNGWSFGDIIIEIDGQTIASTDDMLRIMDLKDVGDEAAFVFERDGKHIKRTIKLQAID